ncbi:helix-turn-helix domain-containing protein [Pseudomonas arsenicoxydans]|uniref:XRE family transcriptional regulator n=1 Tax=Pseudomonas arsenicoxydans TaxID=702115 RepID=A0A502HSL3_9PSED|nr:LexA family transcriptional regulator [Pseudomonas arsenicoxydans]TPG76332.1 XRE family transcriptional regulator [Pseudomonas arsenicoxydans]
MNLAQRLKKARKHAHLSQTALAAAADVKQSMISQLETGASLASANIVRIAFACGVNPMWLAEGAGEMLPSSDEASSVSASDGNWPMFSWEMIGSIKDISELKLLKATEMVLGPERAVDGFALKVKTPAMTSPYPGEKSYPVGCTIFVNPHRAPSEGSRVVVSLPEPSAYDFKTYSSDGNRRLLIPINPQYKVHEITPDTVILGVVMGTYIPE